MSKNVVYMVKLADSVKPGRTDAYDFSIRSWKSYCDKHDAELFILRERIYDESYMNAIWHKIFSIDVLKNSNVDFNKILVADCDTIIHPDAPNIFDVADDNICAIHNMGCYDWIIRSMENYSHELFDGYMFPLREYINSGILVINGKHAKFFNAVHDFYRENSDRIVNCQRTYGTGTDQPVINFLYHILNEPVTLLPFEWNMQELPRLEILDTDLTFTKFGYIYHFNGIPPTYKLYPNRDNESAVYQWMEYTYNKLYAK